MQQRIHGEIVFKSRASSTYKHAGNAAGYQQMDIAFHWGLHPLILVAMLPDKKLRSVLLSSCQSIIELDILASVRMRLLEVLVVRSTVHGIKEPVKITNSAVKTVI